MLQHQKVKTRWLDCHWMVVLLRQSTPAPGGRWYLLISLNLPSSVHQLLPNPVGMLISIVHLLRQLDTVLWLLCVGYNLHCLVHRPIWTLTLVQSLAKLPKTVLSGGPTCPSRYNLTFKHNVRFSFQKSKGCSLFIIFLCQRTTLVLVKICLY